MALPDAVLFSSRYFFGLYLEIFVPTLFLAKIAGIQFFRFYDFRRNDLVFEYGVDREVLKTVAKAYPLVGIVLLSLTVAWLAVNAVRLLGPLIQVGAVSDDSKWLWDRGVTLNKKISWRRTTKAPGGVPDLELFEWADAEFRRCYEAAGNPFFAALLKVSLQSPWHFPAGEIDSLPTDTRVPPGFELNQLNYFLYADYRIGKCRRTARQAPYSDNTLFVLVDDHVVHLRCNALFPIDEFIVPALFLTPKHMNAGRVPTVASQMDFPTAIMGIPGGA